MPSWIVRLTFFNPRKSHVEESLPKRLRVGTSGKTEGDRELIKTEDAAERDRGVSARFPPVVPVPHAGTRVKRRDQRGEKAPKARAG